MEIQTEKQIKEVLQLVEKGELLRAQQLIDNLLDQYIECKELIYTNRCCIFLADSIHRINEIKDKYEQSEYLYSHLLHKKKLNTNLHYFQCNTDSFLMHYRN